MTVSEWGESMPCSVKANNTLLNSHLSCEKEDQLFVQVQCHHLTFILANTGNRQNNMYKHVTLQSHLICA